MSATTSVPTASSIRNALHPTTRSENDYDALLEMIGDAPVVLLGEASHGTHEF